MREQTEEKKTVSKIVPVGVVQMLVTPQEVMNAWKIWQEMKKKNVVIDGRGFPRKSFWREGYFWYTRED